MNDQIDTLVTAFPDSVGPSEWETLCHALLEMSHFPIAITVLADSRCLLVNTAFCKWTGYTKENIIGRTLDEVGQFRDPEDRQKIRDALARDGELRNFQSRVYRKRRSAVDTNLWIKKIRFQNQDCALTIAETSTPDIQTQRHLNDTDKRFHTILSNIKEAYYEVDSKGWFTFFNDSLAALFGCSSQTLMGRDIKSFASDADVAKLAQAFHHIASGERSIEFVDFTLIWEDNTQHMVEASISPFGGVAGRTDAFYGIVRDHSEQKKAEEAIRRSEEKYRRILEEMEEGYYEINLKGDFTDYNSASCKFLGYSADEILGLNFRKYVRPEEAARVQKIFAKSYQLGEAYFVQDYEVIHRDGTGRLLEMSGYPLRNPEGAIIGFWGITRDRTEQRRYEIEVQRSEEKYRRILEEMEEGYYEIDLYGNMTAFNPATMKLHNCTAEELMGMNSRDFLEPGQFENTDREFRKSYENGEPILIHEQSIVLRDGSTRVLEVSGYPIRTPEGRVVGFWGITRDRTEKKRAELALQKSEEQYRLLVNNANDAIYITQAGRIEYHNPKTLEITGFGSDEVDDLRIENLVHPKDKKAVYDVRRSRLIQGEIPEPFTFRMYNKARELLWVELNAIGITWEGRPATLNFLRDVTQLKKTEERLAQAQKMEAIGTLAGGIAHDFNNILSAIIGFCELALDDAEKSSLLEINLRDALIASDRAKDLVHQILSFARRSEEDLSPVKVMTVIKEALKLIRSSIPSTIHIRSKIASPSFVMGSATQIHQIVMNLCTNAAHAMEETGGVLTVDLMDYQIRSGRSDDAIDLQDGAYLNLKVSDTGCGISPEIMNNIFDPYFTTKDPGEGTGMGLSVVRGIVENYGGKIHVESQLGKGTTFTLFLPICKEHTESFHPKEKRAAGRGERILFVDDEWMIVKMASRIMQKDGYQVTVQTSSEEALERFAAQPDDFDLVITDMTMPDITGDKLAAEILRIRPDIPVILCTGYSKKINEEMALEMGIKAFIDKPIDRNEFSIIIRNVLDETN